MCAAIDRLRPEDRFNLIAFGDDAAALFERQRLADAEHKRQAISFAGRLVADRGGTRIDRAFDVALRNAEEHGDILLITDGEVTDFRQLAQRARNANQRIFTVGVGTAPAEDVIAHLASGTGGAAVRVLPREDVAGAVLRQFARIYAPHPRLLSLESTPPAAWCAPNPPLTVFHGDTVHVFLWFEGDAPDCVEARFADDAGREWRERVDVNLRRRGDDLARLAVARHLADAGDKALSLALAHRLLSEHTHFVLVDRHTDEEQRPELPALRVVPHMLAAGWGGVGSVLADFDMPVVLCRRRSYEVQEHLVSVGEVVVGWLEKASGSWWQPKTLPETLSNLVAVLRSEREGTLEKIAAELEAMAQAQPAEEVVVAFYHMVLTSFGKQLGRNSRRAIKRVVAGRTFGAALTSQMQTLLGETCVHPWRVDIPAFLRRQS